MRDEPKHAPLLAAALEITVVATRICVWHDAISNGWFWDTAEDHGGYDRVCPEGPFLSATVAERNATDLIGNVRVEQEGLHPLHYPESWRLWIGEGRP